MTRYHIGVDSTDSATLGMCTTYLGAVLLEKFSELPLDLISPPELVRLNPNVPWKTRGNGAVCLRYEGPEGLWDEILFILENTIWNMSVFEDPQTNPGCVVLEGEVPDDLRRIYHRALHEILDLEEVREVGHSADAVMKGWKNERGLIGALAAVGADLSEHTYETILYRPGGIKDRDRKVVKSSLREASLSYPSTFFNVDDRGEPVCIPHSPCPVILGIRGTDPSDCLNALKMVKAEGFERWVLWKTNQHTDAHIEKIEDISDLQAFSSVTAKVIVRSSPEYLDGGHLFFEVGDGAGNTAVCAAYEPTKGFRKRLAELVPGDKIRVWGSVRSGDVPEATINLEKVEVLDLAEMVTTFNPRCPECGGPTGSMGSGQGLRCKKCGYRGTEMVPVERTVERTISPGLMEPPPEAWRHLFRPSTIPEIDERPYHGPWWGVGAP
jgi:tRNA(Ile2)-agmatinylcytidine synthase